MKPSKRILWTAIAFSLLSNGCSEQAFVPTTKLTQSPSPGTFVLPAKVDILFAQDDSPSMKQAFPTIREQFPKFLSNIADSGWDYRFATIPLSHSRKIDQVMVSKYDANWFFEDDGSSWLPPYPGASPTNPLLGIPSSYFTKPEDYTGFLSEADINSGQGQFEDGFRAISQALYYDLPNKFLRKDALLAVVVVGNGDDGSGVNFCTVDGLAGPVPCEVDPYCQSPYSVPSKNQWHSKCEKHPSRQSSFTDYKNDFNNLVVTKRTAGIRFYSAVSFYKSTDRNCIQSNSAIGYRYIDMAKAFEGESFDLCTQDVTSILEQLKTELVEEKNSYRTRYLVISEEPKVETLKVWRYVGGDTNQKEEIPNDATNGWTYLGGPLTVMTIDSPIPLNEATGYIIELHGTGRIEGSDSGAVEYEVVGSTSTAG